MIGYDPERLRQFYNTYGEREWDRFERPIGRVQAHVITRFLERHVAPGSRVLDAGSGPGRFAIATLRRGCTVTLVDLSEVLLAEAERRIREAGLWASTDGLHRCSYLDLEFLEEGRFDAVLCLGGSLNYMPEQVPAALAALRRVLRPGGVLIAGVMSTLGTLRLVLAQGWTPAADGLDGPGLLQVFGTGTLEVDGRPISEHAARMFTLGEAQNALTVAGFTPVESSATECLLGLPNASLESLAREPAWEALLECECAACVRAPEAGAHLLVAARRA